MLPDNALFCHRCGKPQREFLPVAEPDELPPPAPAVIPPPIPEPPSIGFHNGTAVRIGLVVGVLSIPVLALAGQLAFLRVLSPVWLVAAGFLTVFLYRRRTGQRVSASGGAHLGWICGIFGFLLATAMLAMMAVALSEPSVVSTMRTQWADYGRSEADLNQMIQMIRNPANIAGTLLTFLLLFSVLPAFGGLIGAKFLDRDGPRSLN